MKKFILLIATLAVIATVGLFLLGRSSGKSAAPGLVDGSLARCPDTPNCVCSEHADDPDHYVEPIGLPVDAPADPLATARAAVIRLGGSIQAERPDYLAASFASTVFGFVDDVEIRFDASARALQVRSASRVGRRDLGVNRRRVEALRAGLSGTMQTTQR